MSASNLPEIPSLDQQLSDRDILEAILVSQQRTELLVAQAVENIMPLVEGFSKGGIMGLMGKLR